MTKIDADKYFFVHGSWKDVEILCSMCYSYAALTVWLQIMPIFGPSDKSHTRVTSEI